jgi:hypothetical protein
MGVCYPLGGTNRNRFLSARPHKEISGLHSSFLHAGSVSRVSPTNERIWLGSCSVSGETVAPSSAWMRLIQVNQSLYVGSLVRIDPTLATSFQPETRLNQSANLEP